MEMTYKFCEFDDVYKFFIITTWFHNRYENAIEYLATILGLIAFSFTNERVWIQ
jgi:hypothetical protein